jgi:hypothetical protein
MDHDLALDPALAVGFVDRQDIVVRIAASIALAFALGHRSALAT